MVLLPSPAPPGVLSRQVEWIYNSNRPKFLCLPFRFPAVAVFNPSFVQPTWRFMMSHGLGDVAPRFVYVCASAAATHLAVAEPGVCDCACAATTYCTVPTPGCMCLCFCRNRTFSNARAGRFAVSSGSSLSFVPDAAAAWLPAAVGLSGIHSSSGQGAPLIALGALASIWGVLKQQGMAQAMPTQQAEGKIVIMQACWAACLGPPQTNGGITAISTAVRSLLLAQGARPVM